MSRVLKLGSVLLGAVVMTAAAAAGVERATTMEGAKLYIAPMGGFENYLTAAMIHKGVPVEVVAEREGADFEMVGSADTTKATWAKMWFMRSASSDEDASITVRDLKTGQVVYAYEVDKKNSFHGKQSAAEACAKHFKEAITKGKD